MRLIVSWPSREKEIIHLMPHLLKKKHEILYVLGPKKFEDQFRKKFPNVTFHSCDNAYLNMPAKKYADKKFAPPSSSLLRSLSKTETEIMTMMNRAPFDKMNVSERKYHYYGLIQYWKGVIENVNPDAILFPLIPHTPHDYILYSLARKSNVRTFMFENTFLGDRVLMFEDYTEGCRSLKEIILKNQGKKFVLEDLSQDLQRYYQFQLDPKRDCTPGYMKEQRRRASDFSKKCVEKTKQTYKCFKRGTLVKAVMSAIRNRFTSNLAEDYNRLTNVPKFDRKFIYCPLAFQPERTTSPQGGVFVDQILMVQTISAALPDNWQIYVKEHPSQWWLRTGTSYSASRYPGYYKKLSEIKNVKLLPIHTNSFDLICQSEAVAVATGTAGWEAMLRSKPAIVFGYPWYRECPCVLRVQDTETCQKAIDKIRDGLEIKQSEIIGYLKSFEEASWHGYLYNSVPGFQRLTLEDSVKNRADAILSELER